MNLWRKLTIAFLLPITILLGANCCLAAMYAYLPNTDNDSITVVDIENNVIVAEITVGDAPMAVATSLDGQYVYVANSGSGTVSVIRSSYIFTNDDEIVATIPVGSDLQGMALDPDGDYLYVVSAATEKVAKIRTSDNSVISNLNVGNEPVGVAVSSDGDKVFVTNGGDNTVSVIESGGTNVISVGANPAGVVAATYTGYVYVANSGDGTITVINGDSLAIVGTVAVGLEPWDLGLASWDSYLFVCNSGDGTVSLVNAVTLTVINHSIAVGSEPRGLSVGRNGSRAFVIDPMDNTLSIVDTSGQVNTLDNNILNNGGFTNLAGPMGLGNFLGGDPPEVPEDVTINDAYDDGFSMSWSDQSWSEDGFKIEIKNYSADNPEFIIQAITAPDVESCSIGGLNDDVQYGVRMASFNEVANSDYTVEIVVTTDEEENDSEEEEDGSDCFISSLLP